MWVTKEDVCEVMNWDMENVNKNINNGVLDTDIFNGEEMVLYPSLKKLFKTNNMLVSKESVCEILNWDMYDLEYEIEEDNLKVIKKDGKDMISYNSITEYFDIFDKVYYIQYFTKEDGVISDYLEDVKIKEIMEYNTLTVNRFHRMDILKYNTFHINPIVKYSKYGDSYFIVEKIGFSSNSINQISEMLNEIFSPNRKTFFNEFMDETQFYHSDFDISDYSIIRFRDFTIVFHLDLYNGLGITINSIWENDDFKLKKEFPKEIKLSIDDEYRKEKRY